MLRAGRERLGLILITAEITWALGQSRAEPLFCDTGVGARCEWPSSSPWDVLLAFQGLNGLHWFIGVALACC